VKLRLWQKLWLLFTVIWVVVAALNALTILAFADEVEWGKAIRPAWLAVVVPALLYLLGMAWQRFRKGKVE